MSPLSMSNGKVVQGKDLTKSLSSRCYDDEDGGRALGCCSDSDDSSDEESDSQVSTSWPIPNSAFSSEQFESASAHGVASWPNGLEYGTTCSGLDLVIQRDTMKPKRTMHIELTDMSHSRNLPLQGDVQSPCGQQAERGMQPARVVRAGLRRSLSEGGRDVDKDCSLEAKNQELQSQLKQAQSLIKTRNEELSNMRGIMKELTEGRQTAHIQKHMLTQRIETLQCDLHRLARTTDYSRRCTSDSLSRSAVLSQEVAKGNLLAQESAKKAQQQALEVDRLHRIISVLDERLALMERLGVGRDSVQSACVSAYSRPLLY